MSRQRPIWVLVIVLGACGGGGLAATTTTDFTSATTIAATTTTSSQSTITTSAPVPTTSSEPTTTTTALEIDVEIVDGTVVGPEGFEVTLGETFDIWVLSDDADELHVHGYDLFFELSPGVPQNVVFVADVPGIFEVELEKNHMRLFEIEVSG